MKKNITYFINHTSNIGSNWTFFFKDSITISSVFFNDKEIELTEKKETFFYNYINNNYLWHKMQTD